MLICLLSALLILSDLVFRYNILMYLCLNQPQSTYKTQLFETYIMHLRLSLLLDKFYSLLCRKKLDVGNDIFAAKLVNNN